MELPKYRSREVVLALLIKEVHVINTHCYELFFEENDSKSRTISRTLSTSNQALPGYYYVQIEGDNNARFVPKEVFEQQYELINK